MKNFSIVILLLINCSVIGQVIEINNGLAKVPGSIGATGPTGADGATGPTGTTGTDGINTIVDVTYSQLTTAISTLSLVKGTYYKITDFATVNYLLDNGVEIPAAINTGVTEPLIVTATSTNTISKEATSTTYPKDIIYYDWNPANWNTDKGFSHTGTIISGWKGIIYFRKDILQNNSSFYDFRNVKFRRWKLNPANYDAVVTYSQYNVVKDTNDILYFSKKNTNIGNPCTDTTYWRCLWDYDLSLNDTVSWRSDSLPIYNYVGTNRAFYIPCSATYNDFYTFGNYTTSKTNLNIGNCEVSTYGTILNNIVFKITGSLKMVNLEEQVWQSTITGSMCSFINIKRYFYDNLIGDNFYDNTMTEGFFRNTIGTYFMKNTISVDFYYNNIGYWFRDNTVNEMFTYNSILQYATHNTFKPDCYKNIIGNNAQSNDIGSLFCDNVIGDNFAHNHIMSGMANNVIGNSFDGLYTQYGFIAQKNTHRFGVLDVFDDVSNFRKIEMFWSDSVARISCGRIGRYSARPLYLEFPRIGINDSPDNTNALYVNGHSKINGKLEINQNFKFAPSKKWYPSSDATNAIIIYKADTITPVVSINTTNVRMGVNMINPTVALDIWGQTRCLGDIVERGGGTLAAVYSARTYSVDTTVYSYLEFNKSHNNTAGTLANTITGEKLGGIIFNGVGSSSKTEGFQIIAKQEGTAGASHIPTNVYFNTHSSSALNSNQLVLKNDGKIGINTASPICTLDVNGTLGATKIQINSLDMVNRTGDTTNTWGNSSTKHNLFNGAAAAYGDAVKVGTDATNGNGARLTAGGIWTDASDKNKKTNINYKFNYGIKTIMKLQPCLYFIKGTKIMDIGLVAQDVKKQIPEVVYGNEGNMSLAYQKLVPVLIQAIQEQQIQINKMQKQIDALINK